MILGVAWEAVKTKIKQRSGPMADLEKTNLGPIVKQPVPMCGDYDFPYLAFPHFT